MHNTQNLKTMAIIKIGDNNVFNEFTNVHLPTSIKKKTTIGIIIIL